MFSHFVRKITSWWLSISVFCGFVLLQMLTIGYVLPIPFAWLTADILGHTTLYLVLAILLWNTLKYAKFNTLNGFQQIIIYAALVILSLTLISGFGMAVYSYMPYTISNVLLHFIPVRLLLSLLTILLLLQYFHFKIGDIQKLEIPFDEQKESFDDAKTVIDTKTDFLERIAVKSGVKIHVVLVTDILYLQADGDYVQIYTATGKYLKEQTMKYFEENLPPSVFVRVHRSCVVNVQTIARVELYNKQSQQLTLKNGHQIKVSQAGYKMLRAKLGL